ncbi:hypothetical protein Tco_1500262 [Tanacetum coccineum]
MAGLPRCNELRHSCCLNEWEDMFMLYCRRAATEDSSLAGEINGLCDKLVAADWIERRLDAASSLLVLPLEISVYSCSIKLQHTY